MKKNIKCIFITLLLFVILSGCENIETAISNNIYTSASNNDIAGNNINLSSSGNFTSDDTNIVDNTIESFLLKYYGTSVITKYDSVNNANIEFSADKNNLSLNFKFGYYKNIKETVIDIDYYVDDVLMPYINSDGFDIINNIEANMGITNPVVTVKMINSDDTEFYVKDFTKTELIEIVTGPEKITLEEYVQKKIVKDLVILTSASSVGYPTFKRTLSIQDNVLLITYYCSDKFEPNKIMKLQALYNRHPGLFLSSTEEIINDIENDVDIDISNLIIKIKCMTGADYTKAKAVIVEKQYTVAEIKSIIEEYENKE